MTTGRSNDSTTGAAPATAAAATAGRRADSDRRHERVLHTITTALEAGDPTTLTVAAVARAAGVHRSFLYRHAELAELLKDAARVGAGQVMSERVTAASLRADLAHTRDRALRAEAQVRGLQQRLSEALGHQVWAETGLGPVDEAAELRRVVEQLRQ